MADHDEGRLKFLGDRMQVLRERAGLSQAQMAQAMAVNVRTYQGWESGRRDPGSVCLSDFLRAVKADLGDGLSAIPPFARPAASDQGEPVTPPEPPKRGRPRKQGQGDEAAPTADSSPPTPAAEVVEPVKGEAKKRRGTK